MSKDNFKPEEQNDGCGLCFYYDIYDEPEMSCMHVDHDNEKDKIGKHSICNNYECNFDFVKSKIGVSREHKKHLYGKILESIANIRGIRNIRMKEKTI